MYFTVFKEYIKDDLSRINNPPTITKLLYCLLFEPGFKYIFWLRVCHFLQRKKRFIILFVMARYLYKRYTYRFGISIPFNTRIGKGFLIESINGIIINGATIIGEKCTISQGVTIGVQNRGDNKGVPTIGNNVYIAPGSIIFGRIFIGDNTSIAPNAVILKDIDFH
jgi:serine O-acetyltransferase